MIQSSKLGDQRSLGGRLSGLPLAAFLIVSMIYPMPTPGSQIQEFQCSALEVVDASWVTAGRSVELDVTWRLTRSGRVTDVRVTGNPPDNVVRQIREAITSCAPQQRGSSGGSYARGRATGSLQLTIRGPLQQLSPSRTPAVGRPMQVSVAVRLADGERERIGDQCEVGQLDRTLMVRSGDVLTNSFTVASPITVTCKIEEGVMVSDTFSLEGVEGTQHVLTISISDEDRVSIEEQRRRRVAREQEEAISAEERRLAQEEARRIAQERRDAALEQRRVQEARAAEERRIAEESAAAELELRQLIESARRDLADCGRSALRYFESRGYWPRSELASYPSCSSPRTAGIAIDVTRSRTVVATITHSLSEGKLSLVYLPNDRQWVCGTDLPYEVVLTSSCRNELFYGWKMESILDFSSHKRQA